MPYDPRKPVSETNVAPRVKHTRPYDPRLPASESNVPPPAPAPRQLHHINFVLPPQPPRNFLGGVAPGAALAGFGSTAGMLLTATPAATRALAEFHRARAALEPHLPPDPAPPDPYAAQNDADRRALAEYDATQAAHGKGPWARLRDLAKPKAR